MSEPLTGKKLNAFKELTVRLCLNIETVRGQEL